jgi:acyl-homoserine lactone acylase PvdQ
MVMVKVEVMMTVDADFDCDNDDDVAFSGNYIFPPGQDGNIFSFYYDNWLATWSNGQYLPAYMSHWQTDQTLTVQPQN